MSETRLPRAERRRNTEARILGAARRLFAERGFERTTIRAVAGGAGVDPALVMQYFGTKQELFDTAVRISVDAPSAAGPDQLTELLTHTLGAKLGGLPASSVAMLRSMLTHPGAADTARDVLDTQVAAIGASLTGPDAELRAGLIVSTMLGATIGRHLLGITALRDVPAERLVDLIRPGLATLTAPPTAPTTPPRPDQSRDSADGSGSTDGQHSGAGEQPAHAVLLVLPERDDAEELAERLAADGYRPAIVHRDMLAGEDDADAADWVIELVSAPDGSPASTRRALLAALADEHDGFATDG